MKLGRTLLVAFSSLILTISTPINVLARDAMFRAQNDVLYSDDCKTTGDSTSGGSSGAPVATGDGGGCGSNDAAANKQQVWSFLKNKGMTDEGAAGIMGNMKNESGFMPTADNNKTMGFVDSTGKGCRGIVQWCNERNSKLDSFAAERGKSWDCLGLQLEYMWYEMTETDQGRFTAPSNSRNPGHHLEISLPDALSGKDFSKRSIYDTGPSGAALIFHDYFERANTNTGEDQGRGASAEEVYREMTGKEPSSPSAQNTVTGEGGCVAEKPAEEAASTTAEIPAAECGPLVEEVKRLRDEGKFMSVNGTANLDKDLANCTEGPIDCSGGVSPKTLRAFVAVVRHIDSKKMGPVVFASMNTGHPCDGLRHSTGQAVDFWNCKINPGDDDALCHEIMNYLIVNADELGVKQVIHNHKYGETQPCSSNTTDGVFLCLPDHNNEVHMGL